HRKRRASIQGSPAPRQFVVPEIFASPLRKPLGLQLVCPVRSGAAAAFPDLRAAGFCLPALLPERCYRAADYSKSISLFEVPKRQRGNACSSKLITVVLRNWVV